MFVRSTGDTAQRDFAGTGFFRGKDSEFVGILNGSTTNPVREVQIP